MAISNSFKQMDQSHIAILKCSNDISILSNCGANTREPSFKKEALVKVKSPIKPKTAVGDFNISLLPTVW